MTTTKERNGLNFMILVVFMAIGYAVLRYHLLGEVPWKDFPIFILNKGVSLAGITLLSLCVSLGPLSRMGISILATKSAKKLLGISGLLLTIAHVLLSMVILNPRYFELFFVEDGSLSARGSLSLMAGVVSLIMLGVYHQCFKNGVVGKEKLVKFLTSNKFVLGLLLLFGAHLFFVGYHNWLVPANWIGGLPPITLVSFVMVFLAMGISLLGR
ncbi:MAG: hypothetical protein R3299_00845 [Arenibacter sp.]|nr:hypothetical protein [Arenibacter sp.]